MPTLAKIEKLQQLPYKIIDIFPEQISQDNSRFYHEVESYLLRSRALQRFADSVISLILKLLCYERADILIIDETENSWLKPYQGKWLAEAPVEKLSSVMRHIITKDHGSMHLLFAEHDSLISIDGGFSITVYAPGERLDNLLTALCQSEELFYR